MLKSGIFLFIGLLFGRGLGLFREILLAGNIGTGTTADIVVALITLPDIAISILLGNSLAAVFTSKIRELPQANRFKFFLKLTALIFSIFLIIAGLLALNISTLAQLILPSQNNSPAFIKELSWVVWAIPILSLNAVSRVFLQTESRFELLGLENVIFNICIILAILSFTSVPDLKIITIAIIIGAFLRWVTQFIQIWRMYEKNYAPIPKIKFSDFHRYNLALVTGILLQILPIYGRSIVSFFEHSGALSIYNYSYKFIEFPMALGITIVATVVFPKLTELAVDKNPKAHYELILKSQSFIMKLALPLTILLPAFLFTLSYRTVAIRQIPAADLSTILVCIGIGFFSFVFRGLNEFYITVLNSLNDVARPMFSTIFGSLVGLGAIYGLSRWIGIYGGFWGLNIAYLTMFMLNVYFLRNIHSIDVVHLFLRRSNAILCLAMAMTSILLYVAMQEIPNLVLISIWVTLIVMVYCFLFRNELKEWKKFLG